MDLLKVGVGVSFSKKTFHHAADGETNRRLLLFVINDFGDKKLVRFRIDYRYKHERT
jgi:hypothetical protein